MDLAELRNPRAVVFDFDGTLAYVSAEKAIAEIKVPKKAAAKLEELRLAADDDLRVLNAMIDRNRPEEFSDNLCNKLKSAQYSASHLYAIHPDTVTLLQGLHAKHIPVAIFSGGRASEIMQFMETHNLNDCIDVIVDGSMFSKAPLDFEYGGPKPNAKGMEFVLRRLSQFVGLHDTKPGHDVVMIGDAETDALVGALGGCTGILLEPSMQTPYEPMRVTGMQGDAVKGQAIACRSMKDVRQLLLGPAQAEQISARRENATRTR